MSIQMASQWTKELDMLRWILDQPPVIIMLIIFAKTSSPLPGHVPGIGPRRHSLVVVSSNGFLLGIVGYDAVEKAGILFLLAGILPHGTIELPVVLVSIAIGFRLGYLLAFTLARERSTSQVR